MADLGDTAFGVAYRYEFTRTEHQLRPGEGFDPITRPRDSVRERSHTDQHTFQLGQPESWTFGADMPCVPRLGLPLVAKLAHWKQWDDTNKGTDGAALCAGCPVLQQCRQSAMEQESGLSSQFRYTVRGGWTPAQRAEYDLVQPNRVIPPGMCAKGHERVPNMNCNKCLQEKRAVCSWGNRRVTCECGLELKQSSLATHRRRFHKEEESAA